MSPLPQLSPLGSSVVVTGGNRGIGLAAAEAFAEAGCNVVITSMGDPAKGEEECRRIAEKWGVAAHTLRADVGDSGQARRMVREARRLLGSIDIVVCNAGICHFKPILEVTDEDWARHLATNLSGSFYVAQEAAKIMVEDGRPGRIIFTGSAGAFRSNATQTHYCATKGGQHLLMQGLALELAPHGITVNAVAPGWIHTDINDEASLDPAVREPWLKSRCAVGRIGTGEDVKGAYLLLGAAQSSYINAATISVDGGWLAQL